MPEDTTASEFTRLLDYLKITRGFDFSAYKVSSLMRRIQKRMHEVGVQSYAEYIDFLEVHPHEFEPLFDTVLINVTSFFRDTPAWSYLREKVLPQIVADREPDRPIRVWSAGCATGEEAFSLAMLLAETMGEEQFRRRVKIYATDADEGALTAARHASYDTHQVTAIPEDLLDRYFERSGTRRTFRADLRRSIIFGRHDLIQDAAISRLDLLVCRNTLMYFNSEAQERILARFHFALTRDGYLFLGKAETLLTHSNSFRPVDLKHRVFKRSPTANLRDRLLALATPVPADPNGGTRHLRLKEAAYDAGPVAQILLDRGGYLVAANDKARRLFGLSPVDLGRLLQDLEVSYKPVELRSHLTDTYATRTPMILKEVEWRGGSGDSRQIEVQITPLIDSSGGLQGATVSFVDLTHAHQLRSELERSNQELETAYEELQSANEELETTNEELQSTVEELETTNEELQSANEELETINEELHSTNEELRAMNDQLQQRSEELDQLNGYLDAVLAGLRSALVVLDRSLHVKIWSQKAEDLWGVRESEARGETFLDLDIGLPVRELQSALESCLDGSGKAREEPREQQVVLDGVNRRGKTIRCHVRCSPLVGSTGVEGVILLMEEAARG